MQPRLVLVIALFGCGAPSPEKVCTHALDVLKKEMGDKASGEAETKMFAEAQQKCVAEATAEKEKDPEAFAKEADCIMKAGDYAAVQKCSDDQPDSLAKVCDHVSAFAGAPGKNLCRTQMSSLKEKVGDDAWSSVHAKCFLAAADQAGVEKCKSDAWASVDATKK